MAGQKPKGSYPPSEYSIAKRYWPQVNTRLYPKIDEAMRRRSVLEGMQISEIFNRALNEYLMTNINMDVVFGGKKDEQGN